MSEIHHIFPTPVYIDKIEREFTEKELSFVKKLKETAYNKYLRINRYVRGYIYA